MTDAQRWEALRPYREETNRIWQERRLKTVLLPIPEPCPKGEHCLTMYADSILASTEEIVAMPVRVYRAEPPMPYCGILVLIGHKTFKPMDFGQTFETISLDEAKALNAAE